MIRELAQRNIPTHADVFTALKAYRYNLPGGIRHVWLVVTDEHGWFLADDRRKLEGAYARCTLGKGDGNDVLHDNATRMIGQTRRQIEAS